jgi:glycosyltransferase involved in cell wall biosynthesis
MPGLRHRGWRVTLGLVAGRYHNVRAYLEAHPYDDVLSIQNPTGSYQGRIDAIRKAVSSKRPDIVVGVNIVDVYAAVLSLKRQQNGLPRVVATLHGLQADFLADTERYGWIVDGVICTNRLLQELVRKSSGIERDRVLYAPYGVEMPSRASSGDRHGTVLRVAYVGRLERAQKRFQDVVEIFDLALQKGLNIELIVAGEGPEMDWFVREVDTRRLGDRVRILGHLDQSQLVRDVYEVADVLLISSSWETGPIVAWEAMAHGMAVVSSRYVGSGKEGGLVDGHNCLLFEIGDIDAAVTCIGRLADGSSRDVLTENAVSLVRNRYSRYLSIETWAELLLSVSMMPRKELYGQRFDHSYPPGRLDRWFGRRTGEWMRRALGKRFVHREPGGEWPHTYADLPAASSEFLTLVTNADRD